jgi:NADH dehydrogenase
LGRHICKALLDAGHTITVLSRSPNKVASIPGLQEASGVQGDVTDPGSLSGVLDGADAVVGCVQFPNYPMEQPRKGLTFDRYDREGTENLVAEAKRAGVGRYVYLSGAGASITSDKSWYRAKGYAEQSVMDSGLDYAIVRPSWAYGPEDKALNRFAQIAKLSPVIPKLGTKLQQVEPIHVDDLALVVRRVFEREAWNRIFEIGGPQVMTMDAIIETMMAVTGKKRFVLPLPESLVRVASAPLTLLPKPPMTPGGVAFATQDGLVDSSAMREVLGVEPVDLATGLSRYLAS